MHNYVNFASNQSVRPFGSSPPACPNGGSATLTTFRDPSMGNRDIGFGKGINGTFKCPPAPPVKYIPPAPPVKYMTCPDGFRASVPVGAQTFVDPCRGHYITKQTCNCMPKKNSKLPSCCAFRDTSKYNYVY